MRQHNSGFSASLPISMGGVRSRPTRQGGRRCWAGRSSRRAGRPGTAAPPAPATRSSRRSGGCCASPAGRAPSGPAAGASPGRSATAPRAAVGGRRDSTQIRGLKGMLGEAAQFKSVDLRPRCAFEVGVNEQIFHSISVHAGRKKIRAQALK